MRLITALLLSALTSGCVSHEEQIARQVEANLAHARGWSSPALCWMAANMVSEAQRVAQTILRERTFSCSPEIAQQGYQEAQWRMQTAQARRTQEQASRAQQDAATTDLAAKLLSPPQPATATPITKPPGAVLRGSTISGFNRICYYDHMGSAVVITIRSTDLCPL